MPLKVDLLLLLLLLWLCLLMCRGLQGFSSGGQPDSGLTAAATGLSPPGD
jgi:hypothetical protein